MKAITVVFLTLTVGVGYALGQQDPTPFTLDMARQSAVDAPASKAGSGPSPTPSVLPVLHDAQQRIVVQADDYGNYGLRYEGSYRSFSEEVDRFGNRTRVTKTGSELPVELKHEFNGLPVWYERFASDANNGMLLSSVDEGESTLGAKATQFGIKVGFPDWLQVSFPKASINEVRIVTLQDKRDEGIKPLLASEPGGPTLFSLYGITDYEVQYLNPKGKWMMIPGCYVTHNLDVARAFIFAPISTTAIRLVVKGGMGGSSRVVEVEAFEQGTHRNVALASQGGTATASSVNQDAQCAPSGAIDGDETGRLWGSNGGWKDNTPDVPPPPGTVTQQDDGLGYLKTTFSNQFAQVVRTTNTSPRPTSVPKYQSFLLERADVTYTGHTFSASANMTANGIEYWDNSGGSRIESYDTNKQLFYVSDWCDGYGKRPVVRINRDAQNRPTDVYLGSDVGVLQFVYDDKGWVYTRLVSRADDKIRFIIGRPDATGHAPPPTAYPELLTLTKGFMPQYGPIAEWHDSISPVPNIVCSLKDMPYALLPATQSDPVRPARWVIYPFSGEQSPMTNIRVEYNATTIYLYVPSLNSGSMVMGQDMRAFRFARATGSPTAGLDLRSRQDAGARALVDTILIPPSLVTSPKSKRTATGKGSGRGGSGGAQWNDPNPVFADNLDVTDAGTNTLFPLGLGPDNPFPIAPDPRRDPPRTEPPDVNQPPPPTDGCAEDNNSSHNPTESTAGYPPGCPPLDKSHTRVPCTPVVPDQTLLKPQLDWARNVATVAMADQRCRNFLQDPSSGPPPTPLDRHPQSYLAVQGYTGDGANIFTLSQQHFNQRWRDTAYMNGDGSSLCPPITGPNACGATLWTEPNSSVVFVCPAAWNFYATNGPEGAEMMSVLLLHEFLHELGLRESPASSPPGPYPTTHQITGAVKDACGQAIVNAMGATSPPH